jgi:hypothetical protein
VAKKTRVNGRELIIVQDWLNELPVRWDVNVFANLPVQSDRFVLLPSGNKNQVVSMH